MKTENETWSGGIMGERNHRGAIDDHQEGGGVTTYNFVPIQGDGVATNRTLEDTV